MAEEHKCSCKSKSTHTHWFWWMALTSVAVILYLLAKDMENRDMKGTSRIWVLEKQIDYQADKIQHMAEYQAALMPVMSNMTHIISTQTKAIIELKKIADIQMMSSGNISNFNIDLPAMEETLPSSTNGVDLISLFEPSLFEEMKNHPARFALLCL